MKNIGIFIDGENINPKDYACVYEEISSLGRVIVSRVYADWSSSLTEKWNELAINYALEMIHCAKLPRKNSVDIRIIDDIYEFLYETQTVDKYYLISTDADFITPARRVRRKGKEFYGVGYSNSSLLLKNVCDKFIPIEMLRKDVFEDEIPQPKTMQSNQNKKAKKEKKDKLKLRLEKRRLKRQRKKQKKENNKKQNEEQNNKVLEELEEFEINTSSTSSSDEDDYDNFSTAESGLEEQNYEQNEKIAEEFVEEIIEDAINNVLPINSLEYLAPLFPQGLRYVKLKHLYSVVLEKRANFNISIEEFQEELCKNDKILVLPNKFDKITVYDMSALNDNSCHYLWEQINKILEKNENKMIISALKEQLEKQTLLFDQRIWGFTKIKEFLKICFPNKYEFTENEIILV